MNLFPVKYTVPELTSIVNAAENGWSAKCASGGSPTSGWNDCSNGPNVGTTPTCPGHGFGNSDHRLYNSGGSSRVLDPGDVSRGL